MTDSRLQTLRSITNILFWCEILWQYCEWCTP